EYPNRGHVGVGLHCGHQVQNPCNKQCGETETNAAKQPLRDGVLGLHRLNKIHSSPHSVGKESPKTFAHSFNAPPTSPARSLAKADAALAAAICSSILSATVSVGASTAGAF